VVLVCTLYEKDSTKFRKTNEYETLTMISVGLIVKQGTYLKFKHRSIAEYFYARVLVKEKLHNQFKNALFAKYYKSGNNLARFLSCKLPGRQICSVVSSDGLLQFEPFYCSLDWYQDEGGWFLIDHIFENTIAFDKSEAECPWKTPVLVRDTYNNKVFVKWLIERSKRDPEMVRRILIQDPMAEVLASVCLSEVNDVASFVDNVLMVGEWGDKVKRIVKECRNNLLIATKFLHRYRPLGEKYVPCTESLHARLTKFLSPDELKQDAMECWTKPDFAQVIPSHHPQLSVLFASVLTREEFRSLVIRFCNNSNAVYCCLGFGRLSCNHQHGEEC